MMGEFAEGKNVLEKALQNAREINDRFLIGWVELSHSALSYFEGDEGTTIDRGLEAIKCFEDTGSKFILGLAWAWLGAGYYFHGEYETAREHADKGLRIQEKAGMPSLTGWSSWQLGMILRATGDLDRARECADMSLSLAKEHKMKSIEGVAWMLLGSVAGKADPACIDEAQHDILHGISICKEINARSSYAMGYLLSGELFADAGRMEEARENLMKAESLYVEMEITPESYWLKRTQEALRILKKGNEIM
jgi:tetratricopeptide (TPR) repeat protein